MNARLLARFMRVQFSRLNDAVVVSTVPIIADLPDAVGAHRWVYYCVDDFSEWPGLDAEAMRQMEQKLVARADRIIVAGDNLGARIHSLGRASHVISHGIDLEHWSRRPAPSDLLVSMQRPIVLFWGLIDRRLDLDYLRALDRNMSIGSIVLVGPEQDPDRGLTELKRVARLGACAYEKLPALAATAAVLIMPYADLPVTRAMQPLKLKEYLATGLPVVASRLPALAIWSDCLDIAASPTEFATLVTRRCNAGLPEGQALARRRLEMQSWKAKSVEFAKVLFGD